MENKKLMRKTDGQMICGVCNGIADYLHVDVTIVRIITAASFFSSGLGLIAYIAAAVIMPEDKQWK
jgi:phage shock protein PspC (stress-responsive transcriptional regulator)